MTEITAREIGMVHRLVQRITAGWGPSPWRDDLVGSGLLGLAEAAERFDPDRGAPFMAVASINARGRMLDMLRRERRGGRRVGDRCPSETPGGEQILVARDPAAAPPPGRVSSMESTLTRRELIQALHAAINALPARERRALRGRTIEGRTSDDLAAELGVSRRAVNLMCARARGRIREQLAEFGDVAAELLG